MPQLRNISTGKVEYVSQDDVADLVGSGAYEGIAGKRYNIDRKGKSVSVDGAHLGMTLTDATQRARVPATAEEAAAGYNAGRQDYLEDQDLEAFAGAALSGVTLGLSDAAYRIAYGQEAAAEQAAIRAANPYASGAGTIAGMLGPQALGKIAGKGAGKVAGGATGAAILGKAPSSIVLNTGRGLAAKGANKGLSKKILAEGAGGAFEGYAFSAGQLVTDVALENRDITAEGFLSTVGSGVLFGGAVGSALPVGGAIAGKGKKGLDKIFNRGGGQSIDNLVANKAKTEAAVLAAKNNLDEVLTRELGYYDDLAKPLPAAKPGSALDAADDVAKAADNAVSSVDNVRVAEVLPEETWLMDNLNSLVPDDAARETIMAQARELAEKKIAAQEWLRGTRKAVSDKVERDLSRARKIGGKPDVRRVTLEDATWNESIRGFRQADDYVNNYVQGKRITASLDDAAKADIKEAIEKLGDYEKASYRLSKELTARWERSGLRPTAALDKHVERVAMYEKAMAEAKRMRGMERIKHLDRLSDGHLMDPKTGEVWASVDEAIAAHSPMIDDVAKMADDAATPAPQLTKEELRAQKKQALREERWHNQRVRDMRKEDIRTAKTNLKNAEKADDIAARQLSGQGVSHGTKAAGNVDTVDVLAASEMLGLLGVRSEDIPVIGPVVSAYLKFRLLKHGLGKVLGKQSTGVGAVASRAAKARNAMSASVKKFAKRAEKPAKKLAEARTPLTIAALRKPLYDGDSERKQQEDIPIRESRRLFAKRSEELTAAMADPQHARNQLANALPIEDDELREKVADKALARIQFLHDKMPKDPRVRSELSYKWKPPAKDIRKFARYVRAAEDPQSVFKDLESGRVSPEAAETLQTLYPEMYQEAQQVLLEELTSRKEPLPLRDRQRMSILFDVVLDDSMRPEFVAAVQGAFVKQESPPESSIRARADVGSMYELGMQRRASK